MLDWKRWPRLGALALAVLTAAMATVSAASLSDQLKSVERRMSEQQSKQEQAQRQVDSISEQLKRLQVEQDEAEAAYQAIEAKLAATQRQIAANEQILAAAERRLAERSRVLNRRVRDIYQYGQLNYLDVLLGAHDFNDFTTRMDLLKRIMGRDAALIDQVKAERRLILTKRAELENDQRQIVRLRADAKAKKEVIAARKAEREKVLAKTVNDRDSAERAYRELMETSRRIEIMLRQSDGYHGAIHSSGRMIWPVRGPITSPFGWRMHPIWGRQIFHSGIDIGVDYGTTVVAADSGVVVSAGWLGGYGYAVIIDHGGGLSSLYGHNSRLLVSAGQRVGKGQPIALAGSTGNSTGPHCHFEVRENGSPVSPLKYLP